MSIIARLFSAIFLAITILAPLTPSVTEIALAQTPCPGCYNNVVPMNGWGAAKNLPPALCDSCAGDERRVIIVRIDHNNTPNGWGGFVTDKWEQALQIAADMWNAGAEGEKTGYFLVVDENNLLFDPSTLEPITPNIVLQRDTNSALLRANVEHDKDNPNRTVNIFVGTAYLSAGESGGQGGGVYQNLTAQQLGPNLAHEIGHHLGLWDAYYDINPCTSIMDGLDEATGMVVTPTIQLCDIRRVNAHFANPQANCTVNVFNPPTPLPEEIADLVFTGSGDIEPINGSFGWWTGVSGATPVIRAIPSNAHGFAWQSGAGGRVLRDLPFPTDVVSAGTRWYRTTDTTSLITRFAGLAPGQGREHLDLVYVAGGNFSVRRNVTTVLYTSTTGRITPGAQYYFEMTAGIDDVFGNFTVNVYDDSGTLIDTITKNNVDTRDGIQADSVINKVTTVIFGPIHAWEDVWIDASGKLYGRSQVEILKPNGTGDLTQLARAGADSGMNYSQVDEVPVVVTSESDHLNSTVGNQTDTYVFSDRTVSGTPRAVGVAVSVQAISGAPTFKVVLRIGGVTYEGSRIFTAPSLTKFYAEYWNYNPDTGKPWTNADINNLQAGIKWIDPQGRTRGVYMPVLVTP